MGADNTYGETNFNVKVTTKKMNNSSIKQILKRAPLKTRLYVLFQFKWLDMNINPIRPLTGDEIERCTEWADKVTEEVLADIKEWEEDGRPGGL